LASACFATFVNLLIIVLAFVSIVVALGSSLRWAASASKCVSEIGLRRDEGILSIQHTQ
jgi:hypothetical protein